MLFKKYEKHEVWRTHLQKYDYICKENKDKRREKWKHVEMR